MNQNKNSTLILIIIVFFVSLAAAGVVPLFAISLKEHNIQWGFIPYFFFVFLGQLFVYKSKKFEFNSQQLPYLIVTFCLTLVGINLMLYESQSSSIVKILVFFRTLEGFIVGISLPIIFETIINSNLLKDKDQRLLLLNSTNLMGYLLGIIIADWWIKHYSGQLFLWINIIILFSLTTVLIIRNNKKHLFNDSIYPNSQAENSIVNSIESNIKNERYQYWYQTFFLLFLAKCYYGYFFSYLLYEKAIVLFDISIVVILVCLCNILGQISAIFLSKKLSLQIFSLLTPSIFTLALILFYYYPYLQYFLLLSLIHAILYFLGLKRISQKPNSAKSFALINALSDPGMVLGSSLSVFSLATSIQFLAILSFIPFLYYLIKKIFKNTI
jgi:hypothetical protein